MTERLKCGVYSCNAPSFSDTVASVLNNEAFSFLNSPEYSVFPGFCDVHVHFREPGFSYK